MKPDWLRLTPYLYLRGQDSAVRFNKLSEQWELTINNIRVASFEKIEEAMREAKNYND